MAKEKQPKVVQAVQAASAGRPTMLAALGVGDWKDLEDAVKEAEEGNPAKLAGMVLENPDSRLTSAERREVESLIPIPPKPEPPEFKHPFGPKHNIGGLPKWAQELLDHLLGGGHVIYRCCKACGWPSISGYVCGHCGEDDSDISAYDAMTRFVEWDLMDMVED